MRNSIPIAPAHRVRTSLLLALSLAFVAAAVTSAAEKAQTNSLKWNDSPVVAYARLAPLDHLRRDFTALAASPEARNSLAETMSLIDELSLGVDASRPAGGVLYADSTLNIVLFVPLKDEAKLLATVQSKFGKDFKLGSDGLYAAADTNIVARVSGSWLYLTGSTHAARLSRLPEDPTTLFVGLDPTIAAQAGVLLGSLPSELKESLTATVSEAFAAPPPSDGTNGAVRGMIGGIAKRIVADTARVDLEFTYLRLVEQFHLTTRLASAPQSQLAKWIDAAAERPATFDNLGSNDAVATFVSSLAIDPTTLEPVLRAWDEQVAKARATLPSPQDPRAEMRAIGKPAAQFLDAVSATLRKGVFDGGFTIERAGKDHYQCTAGGTLYSAKAIEEAAIDAATSLQNSAAFQALGWAASANGDVSLHQFKLPAADATSRRLFGDAMYSVFGFGPDGFFAVLGDEEGIVGLSQSLDRIRDARPAQGTPLRFTLHMSPLLSLLAGFPGKSAESDRSVRNLAERTAPYSKNDLVEFAVRAESGALESRVRMDLGVVRAFASSALSKSPVGNDVTTNVAPTTSADANRISLRLARGEAFPLEFLTETKVATKIGAGERVDIGRYSLTYDFRVLDVSADGTMEIETWLNRATIDKETPEGKSSFDTARPAKPEQTDAEMLLHSLMVNRKVVLTVRVDGTIVKISGLDKAVESALNDLNPPTAERDQARAFISQGLSEKGLRDTFTRGFEFYPPGTAAIGARWTRTVENYSSIDFLLDNRYELKSATPDEAVFGVKSQVREKEASGEAKPAIQWDIAGSQSGSIRVDRRNGKLLLGEYALHLQGEATQQINGKPDVRPITADFKVVVGSPDRVAVEKRAKR